MGSHFTLSSTVFWLTPPAQAPGRSAVHRDWLAKDRARAIPRRSLRVANAADAIGIRGIVAHSISEEAKKLYQPLGFDASPSEPMKLMVTLSGIRAF